MDKKKFLDSIQIPVPCEKSWDSMTGDDQSRFCGSCEKEVYNLSAMTRREARRILFESGRSKVCVRIDREPTGKLEILKKQFHQITRQAPIAAGILSATLTISMSVSAQSDLPVKTDDQSISAKSLTNDSQINFTVYDVTDAVIAGTTVILTDIKNEREFKISAGEDGVASFNSVPQGNYKVKASAPYFVSNEFNIEIKTATISDVKITLNVGTVGEVITVRNPKNNSLKQKTSQIPFTIYYSGGHVLPEAEVKLINQKTKAEFVASTDRNGTAQFSLIPRGRYEIFVNYEDLAKFSQFIQIKEEIEPDIKITLDFSVFVGLAFFDWSEIPLFQAIIQKDNETVKQLIYSGFDVNTKYDYGETALHVAVRYGNLEMVRFLLEKGAKLNAKSKSGMTPILGVGNNLDGKNNTGVEILRLLIAEGADVNTRNADKNTLLLIACEKDNIEAVKVLLEAKADPNLKGEDGETALHKTGSDEIKNLLKSYGAR